MYPASVPCHSITSTTENAFFRPPFSLSGCHKQWTKQYGPQYDWGNSGKGILNGGFFWGSFAGTIPAGFLAERYGGKTLTTIGLFISALFTALTPIMCDMSFWAFFANRVIIGLAGVSLDDVLSQHAFH